MAEAQNKAAAWVIDPHATERPEVPAVSFSPTRSGLPAWTESEPVQQPKARRSKSKGGSRKARATKKRLSSATKAAANNSTRLRAARSRKSAGSPPRRSRSQPVRLAPPSARKTVDEFRRLEQSRLAGGLAPSNTEVREAVRAARREVQEEVAEKQERAVAAWAAKVLKDDERRRIAALPRSRGRHAWWYAREEGDDDGGDGDDGDSNYDDDEEEQAAGKQAKKKKKQKSKKKKQARQARALAAARSRNHRLQATLLEQESTIRVLEASSQPLRPAVVPVPASPAAFATDPRLGLLPPPPPYIGYHPPYSYPHHVPYPSGVPVALGDPSSPCRICLHAISYGGRSCGGRWCDTTAYNYHFRGGGSPRRQRAGGREGASSSSSSPASPRTRKSVKERDARVREAAMRDMRDELYLEHLGIHHGTVPAVVSPAAVAPPYTYGIVAAGGGYHPYYPPPNHLYPGHYRPPTPYYTQGLHHNAVPLSPPPPSSSAPPPPSDSRSDPRANSLPRKEKEDVPFDVDKHYSAHYIRETPGATALSGTTWQENLRGTTASEKAKTDAVLQQRRRAASMGGGRRWKG